MTERSTAALLAGYVRAAGVRHIFGYPGESVIDFMEAARQQDIAVVSAVREATAAFMAEGAAMATGRPGVCLSTLGPGSTAVLNGVASATLDRVPMLAISGQIESSREQFFTHQVVDHGRLFAPVTKLTLRLDPASADIVIRKALRTAVAERPGAVHLTVTADAWPVPPGGAHPAAAPAVPVGGAHPAAAPAVPVGGGGIAVPPLAPAAGTLDVYRDGDPLAGLGLEVSSLGFLPAADSQSIECAPLQLGAGRVSTYALAFPVNLIFIVAEGGPGSSFSALASWLSQPVQQVAGASLPPPSALMSLPGLLPQDVSDPTVLQAGAALCRARPDPGLDLQ
jgi:hypothetical protein